MAMNVSSSTSATLRQTQQQSQTQQAKATQEADQERARQAQQTKKAEQPRPVVNTQGQTTGKVINTTA